MALLVGAAVWGISTWLLQDLDKLPTLAEQVSARIEAVRTALAAGAGVGAAVTLLLAVRRQRHQELATAHTTHDAAERRTIGPERWASTATCPSCGTISARTHGGYRRRLADLPISGRPVRIEADVRRFRCDDPGCGAATFAEQIPGLTAPFARRTAGLTDRLAAIALALAGRAGSRLAAKLGMPTCRDTLIRLIRALPEPPAAAPTVIGVDDFALRKGAVYGTLIIDMTTHRPIDIFPGRDAATLAAWLADRPGVEVICRDRAGSYANGARVGAPDAIEVADRWHLWANLGAAVEKTVSAHAACLPEPPLVEDLVTEERCDEAGPPSEPDPPIEYPLARRHRERHAAILELLAAGRSRTQVARELGISARTVYRFAGTPLEQHLGRANNRTSRLDRFRDHLHQRFADGIHNARALHREIELLGWRGSPRTVERYVAQLRERTGPPPTAPTPPKPRKVASWIMSDPDHLTAGAAVQLKNILARCPELEATRHHVGSFANMIQNLDGDRLPTWIDAVRADGLPALHSFATSLTRDQAAVTAGLTLPWSNGPTEGTVNRLKMIKRSMYGRANLDLLRRRVLII
ncbi:ISL3 family transposase [Nonomuraea sp. NPDC050643]|uniref:ISL3 family transposase n=1 Tax=Nonomuraea sp. NPDC050643 TaxID=3155660 RepID=UPI0033FE987C